MNLQDFKYLVALADHHHFSKAADACFVTQPALSIQIKKLEKTLGVPLIERINRSFLLTDAGKSIAEQARHILYQVKEIKEFAKQASDPFRGEFNLGVLPTLAPYLFPHILPYLSSEILAKLKIYLSEQQTAKLISSLKQGQIDAALLSLPVKEKNLVALPLFEEELCLAVPKNNPLAKRKLIRHADLKNKTLLLLEEGHCLRTQALDFCHHSQSFEETNFRASSLETLRYMVASNVGITLMPKIACHPNDCITYRSFKNPTPNRTIALAFRASTPKMLLLERLAMKIKEAVKKERLVKIIF